ncbi:MaoC/PaaZ C-terminal domain-containing protein [Pseudomonas sp. SZMC_28357]|jgi:acyl dehydratase|uniref:MaoC family dehydratase n=1 Tax=Pseudomonas sp. SZMC_28357 TaxID=3074380 RepID=UPI002870F926|nr:MaoC/PaaZ C-terminal domain-containing protein [Pseudomonas sp. SZMC_28357]MDR9753741.1 MaoC/PaaZ C-terminal domain-containing protein [Pseudomonas sp. SZMC_28357]
MSATLYFDDLAVRQSMVSSRTTLTETHIVLFAGLTGDFNPLHMDEETAREGVFGRRIAHGMLAHSMSTGLRSSIDDWAIIAFLETQRRFVAPVFAGDTLHYVAEVEDLRKSNSNPTRGIVRVSLRLLNQSGEVVQQGEDVFAVACRTGSES